jgi:hypothetical protein
LGFILKYFSSHSFCQSSIVVTGGARRISYCGKQDTVQISIYGVEGWAKTTSELNVHVAEKRSEQQSNIHILTVRRA